MNLEYALQQVRDLATVDSDPNEGVHWAIIAEILADAYKKEKARADALKAAIEQCIAYANNRETEWGSRAEAAFAFLYNAIGEAGE